MSIRMRTLAFAAVAPLVLGACATKGWVRKELTAQRAVTDSSIAMERTARISGDSATSAAFAAQLASLRLELDSMRSQFNARIAVVEQGLQFALPVTFAFDDATVNQADHEALQRFAQIAAKYYPGSAITIEGFADPAGSQAYNLNLSRRRAENVRGYLTSFGLADTQLKSVGYGEARPVVPGAERDAPGADRNRRVVFVIESKGDPMVALATPDE